MRPVVLPTSRGKVEYQLEGEKGPVVVAMHGAPGSCLQMSAYLDRLGITGANCRRLTWSRPGYRRTPLDSGTTPAAQAELLHALLGELALPRPVILTGFSAGGVSALDFTLRFPESVEKLLLFSPVTGSYPMFGHSWHERLLDRILYSDPTLMFASFLSKRCPRLVARCFLAAMSRLHGAELKEELNRLAGNADDREFLLDMLRRCVPFIHLKRGMWNDDRNVLAADRNNYRALRQPMLLLCGELDGDVPPDQSLALHRLLPETSLLVRFPRANHLLLMEPHLAEIRERATRFCGLA